MREFMLIIHIIGLSMGHFGLAMLNFQKCHFEVFGKK